MKALPDKGKIGELAGSPDSKEYARLAVAQKIQGHKIGILIRNVETLLLANKKMLESTTSLKDELNKIKLELVGLQSRVRNVESILTPRSNLSMESARKENAMSTLTQTELQVLRILASVGPTSSNKMSKAIVRTREHTARLMKSLLERKLVRREDIKAPYIYGVEEGVKKLLKTK